MTDISPPPLPKKGLSVLAIAGIGCGGLFLLACIGGGLLLTKGCSRGKEGIGDSQKCPVMACAKLIVAMDRSLELIDADEATKRVTLKDKQTGEIITSLMEALPSKTPLPGWVPGYPGASAKEGGMRMKRAGNVTGMSMAESTDTVSDVKDFYKAKLEEAGFLVRSGTATIKSTMLIIAEIGTARVIGNKESAGQKVGAFISSEKGKTSIVVTYTGPQ